MTRCVRENALHSQGQDKLRHGALRSLACRVLAKCLLLLACSFLTTDERQELDQRTQSAAMESNCPVAPSVLAQRVKVRPGCVAEAQQPHLPFLG